MIFDRTVGLFLQPMRHSIPYREILQAWLAARFDPAACRRALEEIIGSRRLPPSLFVPSAIERGGMVATEELLTRSYEEANRFGFVVMRGSERAYLRILPREEVPSLGELLRAATQGDDAAEVRRRFAGHADDALLDVLCARTKVPAVAPLPWPEARVPGIYRREHASLLVRSRETSVLFDPLCLALGYFPKTLGLAPTNRAVDHIGAIAITHTHDDHWHLPSVLRWAERADVPVIVPQVPTLSILAPEEPAEMLGLVGQRAIAEPWGAEVRVGDITIDVLPFFGEQPTRLPPGPRAELRNWGNCYRVQTPDFSALVLVDTGADPAGDMLDVVAESARRRGPVDVVLSCVQEFPSPFFGGVATECLTLPFARLRELYEDLVGGRLPSTTAGPSGIVQLCRRNGARHFLPYANGFVHVGRDAGIDWGSGPPEAAVVTFIDEQLREKSVPTRAIGWNAGDAAVFTGGEMSIVPYPFG